MQLSVQHRDDEIQRLSERVSQGTETDFANLSIRNETNEGIILTLNQQVRARPPPSRPPAGGRACDVL